MKYYFYMAGETIGSLSRVDFNSDPIVLDRWDEKAKKWVFTPGLMGISGFASDADSYKEITKQEAERYMKKRAARKRRPLRCKKATSQNFSASGTPQ